MTARERPILFSAPMVRAILSGAKTQTRRIVEPQPSSGVRVSPFVASGLEDGHGRELRIRYSPGDRLWVRETFCDDWKDSRGIQYRADGGLDGDMTDAGCTWRPSIFMPRSASRITLEVTAVRVERLQDISEADAMAEGAPWGACGSPQEGSRKAGFAKLWESINGPGSWDANPWVFAITFKRLT